MSIDDFFQLGEEGSFHEIPVAVEFGTHPHVPVVLLLDRSYSMVHRDNIGQLNAGVRLFKESIIQDDLANRRVDLCVVSFGDTCEIENDFCSIGSFVSHELLAGGRTAMGEAICTGIEVLRARTRQYRSEGIDYYRPWIILMTDGMPTDMEPGDRRWSSVRQQIVDGEANHQFMFFAIGIAEDALPALRELGTERPPLLLRENHFDAMFTWLSSSFSSISRSQPGDRVTGISNPTDAIRGWGDVSA